MGEDTGEGPILKNYGNVNIARKLRHNQTDAELLLWYRLRGLQLEGVKFRRQHPIGDYIVDFVSLNKKLIIEVDGGQHNEPPNMNKDEKRSEWLTSQGYKILRFWNNDVWQNMDGVFLEILRCCQADDPHPNPLP
jgi:very-short-patch-repair endonuclease